MALDRSRVLETAQKHLAKGHYDRAIVEYQKLVRDDPEDVRTWLKIGDLFTRKGESQRACETYQRVASQYAEQGFFLKAVAVYKQILKLDPGRLDASLALADMYEQLQLISDALNTYEHLAAAYARNGDTAKALETLERMADLDPENIPVRIKLAEALSKAGRTEGAASAFEQGAALLREQGRMDDYIKVAERLLYHRPTDVTLARELAELHVERNDPKRALSKLQLCFKADPRDTVTLELLARAFQLLGQLPKTISVYREMARIYQEGHRPEERAAVLKRILELDPADAEARRALAGYAPPVPPPAGAGAPPPPSAVVDSRPRAVEPVEDEPELELLEPEEEEAAEVLDDEDMLVDAEDDIIFVDEEASAEIEIRGPRSPAAPPPAPGPPFRAPASGLNPPPSPPIPQPLHQSPGVVALGAPAAAGAPAAGPGRVSSIPPEVAREAQIARYLTECDVFQRYGLKSKVVDQLSRVIEMDPEHVEARERLRDAFLDQGRWQEAVEQLHALVELVEATDPDAAAQYQAQIVELDPARGPAPSEPRAPQQADAEEMLDEEDSEGLQPMSPEEFEAVPLRQVSAAEAEQSRMRASMPPGEVEEILDEAEFFLAQGLLEEARSSLREALLVHEAHPLLLEKIQELQELEEAVGSSTQPGAVDTDESFELAEKLAEELDEEASGGEIGSDVLDVESVFAQFKKGVEEQIGTEDTETHFDLGIAYKEMGLLDDAVHEFGLATANPQRDCIAYTMMGMCFLEKGEPLEAISHFQRGLEAHSRSPQEEIGLYFEIGAAYEAAGRPQEALQYFEEVQRRDATYREVGERIQAIMDPSRIAPPPSHREVEDVDRAFDDLMGDE